MHSRVKEYGIGQFFLRHRLTVYFLSVPMMKDSVKLNNICELRSNPQFHSSESYYFANREWETVNFLVHSMVP